MIELPLDRWLPAIRASAPGASLTLTASFNRRYKAPFGDVMHIVQSCSSVFPVEKFALTPDAGASSPSAASKTADSPWVATLPCGVKVELIGLAPGGSPTAHRGPLSPRVTPEGGHSTAAAWARTGRTTRYLAG